MSVPEQFQAYRISNDGGYRAAVQSISLNDLNPGEVIVKVAYSSINYKDALAGTGQGKILRKFPLVGGIDLAGTVVESQDARFRAGDSVLVTGSGLSENRDGGYSEYQKLEAQWVVPLPKGLSMREAMGIGTAGFTAALCLWRLQQIGVMPDSGPVVVTGATGGVGMLAVDIFSRVGYSVSAITGKPDRFDFLRDLGAAQCISRHGLHWGQRPMESAMFAGGVDNVGGEMLSGLTRVMQPWGGIASCGMTSGIDVHTTVMPFIIRGISLLGINSSGTPYPIRELIWQHLSSDWKPQHLDRIVTREVGLADLEAVFPTFLAGESFGRTVVNVCGE